LEKWAPTPVEALKIGPAHACMKLGPTHVKALDIGPHTPYPIVLHTRRGIWKIGPHPVEAFCGWALVGSMFFKMINILGIL